MNCTQSLEGKSFYLPNDLKAQKLNSLLNYSYEFNSIVDVKKDYLYLLNKLIEAKENQLEEGNVADDIIASIEEGKIIDRSIRSYNLSRIATAFNDFVCTNTVKSSSVQKTYSELISELATLKEELLQLKNEHLNLEEKNKSLSEQNNKLLEENKEYESRENQIIKILKKEES